MHNYYPRWVELAVLELTRAQGFTIAPERGRYQGRGYGVSPYPQRTITLNATTDLPHAILAYASQNRDLLNLPGHYVGGWIRPGTRDIILDVAIIIPDADAAVRICHRHQQLCYYDFQDQRVGIA